MSKYTSVISGSGEIINSNLDSKISEIYDSIYLEVESIKTKYKEIVKGVVVDENKYNLIISNLVKSFKCQDKKELYELLNSLNSSYSSNVHIKFFLERFNLNSHLYDSIDLFMKKNNWVSTNLFDDLYIINENIKKTKDTISAIKYKKYLDELMTAVHKSRFKNTCIKKDKIKKIVLDESINGLITINNIIESINSVYSIHICMFEEINEFYQIISKITSIINTINKNY